MFGSQILDVAIGLIFIFLMLSLVVTALNEFVAIALKRRPKMLWNGIARLIGDREFTESVYAHPLICTLSKSGTHPSYIPSHTFVLAVLDVLTGVDNPPPTTTQEISAAIAKLPPAQKVLATQLNVLLHDAGGSIEEFKGALEQWFDNSMERVSGWYKRQTQWILLVMAAVVTIWSNADTVVITNTLWRDPAIRSALLAQAQQYTVQETKDSATAAPAPRRDGPPPPPADPPSEAAEYETASTKVRTSVEGISSLALPLGWSTAAERATAAKKNQEDRRDPIPADAGSIFSALGHHSLGWLLTAMAISLGAPFWFDILNKVVTVRASGKAPEEKKK